MQLSGNTDTVLYNTPYTSIKFYFKRKFSCRFSDMTSPMGKLFQTACMMGEKWSSKFRGKQLSSLLTQKFQYRRPFRNHIDHCIYWEIWRDSATSILGIVVASTNLWRAGFQAILHSESFLDSSVPKVFSLHSTGKKWKGEFGSKHTENYKMPQLSILLWCVMMSSCKNERARMTNNISMALVWDFRLAEHSHRNLTLLNIIRANIPSREKQAICRKMLFWNWHFKISNVKWKAVYGILAETLMTLRVCW